MQKTFIFFLLFFCNHYTATAQKKCQCPEYDELKKNNKDDSTIAVQLINSSSLICRAKGLETLGSFFKKINVTDSAEFYLHKAEDAYTKTNCGTSAALLVYKYLGQILHAKGDIPGAQQQFLKMIEAAEKAGNTYELALGNTMIAQMFNQTGQAEKGIAFTRKAIELSEKINEPEKKVEVYFKISKRLMWHYQDTKKESSLDSSGIFSNLQIKLAKQLNDEGVISSAFANLQGVEWERKNYKKALIFLDSAFKYSDTSVHIVMGALYADKADLCIELKDYKKARIFADSSIYYREKTGNIIYKGYGYDLLGSIAKANGDYKTAYEYYVKACSLRDSLESTEKTRQVSELEKKYSQAKNENTIKDLDKKKQFYFFLAIAGLLAAAAIGFFLRQQSLKHKKNILETEQRLNRARMNPHFFFNALTALQKFALKGNDGQAMASNLSKFSNIMRETLESTYKEYVTIEQEMEFLNEYLEVQKIRFPQAFSYSVTADKQLEVDDALIPAMIIQPFVENSIEHGFAGIDYAGNISIHFTNDKKEVRIEIKDNGKGLSTVAKEESEHISRASQIIKDRIYLLNIKLKTKAGFSIDNDETGKGVIVKINLPLLHKSQSEG